MNDAFNLTQPLFWFALSIIFLCVECLKHLLPGPPFLFGSVLALMAIFVTWLIPPSTKNKAPILLANSTTLSSKYHKDNTLVKIGNTSSTYNRTSSSSSIALPSDIKLQGKCLSFSFSSLTATNSLTPHQKKNNYTQTYTYNKKKTDKLILII